MGRSPNLPASPRQSTVVTTVAIVEDNRDLRTTLARMVGARGYLLKRDSPAEILEAIGNVRDGGSPMSSQIARKVVASFREVPPDPAAGTLTEREAEVPAHITKSYSSKEIADKMSVSVNTGKTYPKHICAKLHVRSLTEILLRFRAES